MMDILTGTIKNERSPKVWKADLSNGTYQNPIIFADYSDPDVIRVGEDFFMTASSFNCAPGLPLLHSKDLVNWRIVNNILERLPYDTYDKPQYGKGVWAPSIRYHDGKFWVFFPTPDEGIFMTNTTDPFGKWSEPVLVKSVSGWIDPCPFWDEDGNAYLVFAFAYSRVGFNSILSVCRMKPDGTGLLEEGIGTFVFDGNKNEHHAIEGPKMYKRNGYYYIFAPAGGVERGWQTILRSKNIYGPYEDKIVLHQGNTDINGPHQGGLVELENGEAWFVHFQDMEEYGRIVHLQPVRWVDDWPLMGEDINNDGIGEPVRIYKKPKVDKIYPITVPDTSDDFISNELGLQWQWNANFKNEWYSLSARKDSIRLYAVNDMLKGGNTLWHAPNLLLQKFPSPSFTATARIEYKPSNKSEKAGVVISGNTCFALALYKAESGVKLGYFKAYEKDGRRLEEEIEGVEIESNTAILRVDVGTGAKCNFSYSIDGVKFINIGETFKATKTLWMGSKVGIFCVNSAEENSSGYADFDWFVIERS